MLGKRLDMNRKVVDTLEALGKTTFIDVNGVKSLRKRFSETVDKLILINEKISMN